MGVDLFGAKLDLFQHLMRDYRETFGSNSDERRDQGFFLHGQMVCFLHRILRRILPRPILPEEDDWDSLKCFDFLGKDGLENDNFMLQTSVGDRAPFSCYGTN